jgi:hypothetical protein
MSSQDWRWKIGEVVERVRTRYDFIGRKTGAPFLALVYPPEAEAVFFKEWQTQQSTLRPDFDVRSVNVLEITQAVTADIGAENIVDSLADPMPGSDPQSELGRLWINAVADSVKSRLAEPGPGKPVACMERLAALYPAVGPKSVMQILWDCAQSLLNGPVIVLIPGYIVEPRTYSFLGCRDEFMYRGDLL